MNFQLFKLSSISIRCLIKTLLKNAWMIVATALIFSMCTTMYLQRGYVPQYRSTATYAIMSRNTESSYGSQASAAEMTNVIADLAQTELVRGSIRSYSQKLQNFSGTISATQLAECNLITVSVTSDSPESSFLAIQAFEKIFPTIIGYTSSDCIAQVIRNPSVSASPINYINTASASRKAALIGAGLMALLLCTISVSRETIQTRTGARHLLDSNIIATVYKVRRKFSLRNLKLNPPIHVFSPTTEFAYTEQINTICAQLENEAAANDRRIFLMTGVGENEGKTTLAGNVAAALSLRGHRVALVDCDFRNPSLNQFFGGGYTPEVPLNRLLSQKLSKDSLMQCMVRHEKLGVFMFLSVKADKTCAELLSSTVMGTLIEQLRVFDFVIMDSPPMGYFADAEVLMDNVDATMLVVRQDLTQARDINDAADLLRSAKSHYMGVILNDMTTSITEGQSYGYGYGYGTYGYGYGYGYGSDRQNPFNKKKS